MSNVTRNCLVLLTLLGLAALTSTQLYAQFKLRLDETSNFGPAIVHHVNEEEGIDILVVAWTGTDGNINVMQSRDGIEWGTKVVLDEATKNAPTLADYDGRYYVAWTGLNEGDIYTMRSRDGVDWTTKIKLDERSSAAPSLAVYNERLYLGWVGLSEGDIYVMSTTDGVDWRNKIRTGERTPESIKLCGGHKLAIGFQGQEKGTIYCLMTRDGIDF